jgi:hypothetical protein
MAKEFLCEGCHEAFMSEQSDADMEAEYRADFPELADRPVVDGAILCGDCYKQFMKWFGGLTPAEKASIKDNLT